MYSILATTIEVVVVYSPGFSPHAGQIHDEKLEWKAESKVESLVNADHVPGGGHVKVW